jgi:hypothetical protein
MITTDITVAALQDGDGIHLQLSTLPDDSAVQFASESFLPSATDSDVLVAIYALGDTIRGARLYPGAPFDMPELRDRCLAAVAAL